MVDMHRNQAQLAGSEEATNIPRLSKTRHDSISALATNQTPIDSLPIWAREAQLSSQTRASRASSIFSTQTKTSILTVADDSPESFDVPIGLQRYKFGLDGSILSITQADPEQPTFTPAALEIPAAPEYSPAPNNKQPTFPIISPNPERQRSESAPPQSNLNQPISDASGVSRNPSFTPGKESLSVQKRHASSNSIPTTTPSLHPPSPGSPSPKLRRRNGVRLKLVTRTVGGQKGIEISPLTPGSEYSSISASSQGTVSAEPRSSASREAEPVSPSQSYIRRNGVGATGLFPLPDDLQNFQYARGEPKPPYERSGTKQLPATSREVRRKELPAPDTKPGKPSAAGIDHRSGTHNVTGTHGSGIDDTKISPLIITSPAEVNGAPIGTEPPPSMDSENDISIHYSRLIRTIDKHHREELSDRDREIDVTRNMIQKLAKEILELKTELVWTKSQLDTTPGLHKKPPPVSEQIETDEFHFPPLKLSHLQVMKQALKRRADKIRQGLDDEVRDLRKMSSASASAIAVESSSSSSTREEAASHHQSPLPLPPRHHPVGRRPTRMHRNPQGSLHSSRETNHNLAAGVMSLEAALANPTPWSFWSGQAAWEEQQKARSDSMAMSIQRFRTAIDQAKMEVEDMWETRWKERDRVLLERMRRVEMDAQANVEKAVAERDKEWARGWKRKNRQLLESLERNDKEIVELRRRVGMLDEGKE